MVSNFRACSIGHRGQLFAFPTPPRPAAFRGPFQTRATSAMSVLNVLITLFPLSLLAIGLPVPAGAGVCEGLMWPHPAYPNTQLPFAGPSLNSSHRFHFNLSYAIRAC